MTLHTVGLIAFVLFCMNEVRGLCEESHWTPAKVVVGIPATIAAWVLVVWVVFYL